MPFILPAIAAAVIDAAVTAALSSAGGIFIFGVGISISAAAAGVIGALAASGLMALGTLVFSPAQKRTLSLREPISTHKLIYGQMKVGGAITFIDTTSDNQTLFLVVTLAGHSIFAIDGIYINDTYVPTDSGGNAVRPARLPDGTEPTDYTGHATFYAGTGTVAGDAGLIAALSAASQKWGSNFFQYDRAKLYIRLGWNQNLFGSTGVPNVSCVVRGRMVYDPRETNGPIVSSSATSPGLFVTAAAHNLQVGFKVFIRDHSGAQPATPQPWWPAAQRNAVAQEYEIGTTPSTTEFTLLGPDSQPLALSVGGSGGTVTRMHWSDNSALVANDYLVEPIHGMGVLFDSEVDENQVITNANLCDEIVPRILPTTTFTAQVNPTNTITWVENEAAGPLPPICEIILTSTGSLPAGLNTNSIYYYAQTGGGPVGLLCNTAQDAYHNPPEGVTISSPGTGVHTLTIVETFTADSLSRQLFVFNNTLRITTGAQVMLSNAGGALPGGLSPGVTYYAIFLTDTVMQVAGSLADARIGNPIAFTDDGTGTSFITIEAEPRYTANGVADSGDTRQAIIQKIVSSMGGYVVPSGILLNVYAAQYLTPTVTLDETDLRGPIQLTALQSGATSFNSVKGTFSDPFNKGQPTDYPYVQNQTYIAEDQYEVVWKDLTLEFTNSSSMAQRLAKIDLERIRRELTTTMPLKLTAFEVGSPDTIYVNNAMWGWSGETFEVASWQFSIGTQGDGNPTLDCDIVGRQTDAAVYAWTAAEEAAAKRQTNTNLPNPFVVAPPSGLSLLSGGSLLVQQADGTVVSRIQVSWISPVDQFVLDGGFIDITYKQSANSVWQFAPSVGGSQTVGYIENAQVGVNYDVAVRSRNAIGALSDQDNVYPWQSEITGYTIVGKIAAPSDIATLTVTTNGMTVTLAGSPITDTDVVVYEYRYGLVPTWAAMTLVEQAAAVPNGSGGFAGTCTTGAILAGTWYFGVKALNRSGVYSVNAALTSAVVSNAVPGTSIAAGTLTAAAFAASIQPVLILSGAPPTTPGTFVGQVAVSTTDNQLYRWSGSAWTLAVPAVNITGQLTDAQLAAIAAAKITGQITTTQITNNAITTPLISAGAVVSASIAANTIVAANIAAGTITSTEIAAGTVTATNIAAGTITSGLIAANAITAGAIAAGAINASNIIVGNILVTGQLTANAVTNSVAATSSTTPSVTIVGTGGPILVFAMGTVTSPGSAGTAFVSSSSTGVLFSMAYPNVNASPVFGMGVDGTGAGSKTYTFNTGGSGPSINGTIVAMELKR